MANTYSQSYFHLIFSPKNRQALIQKTWKNELEKYITGIIQNNKHKLLAIGSMPDHIHIFIGYNLNHRVSDLVEEIKTSSNKWIKDNKLSKYKFEWQKACLPARQGYGAFTHSHSQIDAIIKYVFNQEQHHQKRTFKEEYLEILKKNEVKYNEDYLFDFFDNF